ncbi:DNA ligase D [Aquabacter sediminis]|uniref:DNA ligase D n=1 Tax=Aquabacter sediminis TaxID=3029197 RepID=UPI00237E8E54|nr:DNA ligase D [Aquabacter sp. P-9]MDE1566957.1 DNA ligase D [Aquabacter sp. P-9]
MSLATYRKKRNFKVTPEPKGRKGAQKGAHYLIQKHAARRLHYDLRLELDGVLKSWAVTRGPSLVAGEKRLAVEVEDHPLAYGDFEGTIPKGEYGGGTVLLWDQGTWEPIGDPHEGLKAGQLDFQLHGEKLGGRWHLVRMHRKPRETRDNWLLIKSEDDAARPEGAGDILEEAPQSVKTGRVIAEVEGEPPGWSSKTGPITKPANDGESPDASRRQSVTRAKARAKNPSQPKPPPDFVEPMLARLVDKAPTGEGWLHEVKFDGYRLLARIEDGAVRLLTRSALDWTARFGTAIPKGLAALPLKNLLMDGEVIVENGAGASDFSALQADLSEGRSDRFVFYAFDLLHLDGEDLRPLPLIERKARLAALLEGQTGPLRFSSHFDESGATVLRHACRLGLEGVVSKERDAPYRSGRGRAWVKSKCTARQEFVIGGFVPSTTGADLIGSLALGVNEDGKLRYVGRVGTGFSAAVARDLHTRFAALKVERSPFAAPLSAEARRGVTFVRPELVAEVEFRAWTGDGHLRHASFRGLREDKAAGDVLAERPAGRATGKSKAKEDTVPRRTVKLTHPDRIYWPEEGITKEGLADYYGEVWPAIAPFLIGRPLALVRCPDGIHGPRFFQKHAWKGLNPRIVQVSDPKDKSGEPLIAIADLDGLIGLVQAAVLEIHPWGSTIEDWERPDTLVMDLDPGDDVPWTRVIAAAEEIKARMKAVGLAAFVKTSGGKGLHVVTPLKPRASWAEAKAFTKAIAQSMAADSPDLYTATITKSKRVGRILVDYLRNQRGATAVAAYSTRARVGAAVSMPLAWEELSPAIGPAAFTILNTPGRLNALSRRPWDGFRAAAEPLPKVKSRK